MPISISQIRNGEMKFLLPLEWNHFPKYDGECCNNVNNNMWASDCDFKFSTKINSVLLETYLNHLIFLNNQTLTNLSLFSLQSQTNC